MQFKVFGLLVAMAGVPKAFAACPAQSTMGTADQTSAAGNVMEYTSQDDRHHQSARLVRSGNRYNLEVTTSTMPGCGSPTTVTINNVGPAYGNVRLGYKTGSLTVVQYLPSSDGLEVGEVVSLSYRNNGWRAAGVEVSLSRPDGALPGFRVPRCSINLLGGGVEQYGVARASIPSAQRTTTLSSGADLTGLLSGIRSHHCSPNFAYEASLLNGTPSAPPYGCTGSGESNSISPNGYTCTGATNESLPTFNLTADQVRLFGGRPQCRAPYVSLGDGRYLAGWGDDTMFRGKTVRLFTNRSQQDYLCVEREGANVITGQRAPGPARDDAVVPASAAPDTQAE